MSATNLHINPKAFVMGGVIGRKHFFLNSLLFTAMAVVPMAILAIGASLAEKMPAIAWLSAVGGIVMTAPILVFAWANMFKRVRDIRGTTENETLWFIGTLFVFLIPYIGSAMNIAIMCWPGKITLAAAAISPNTSANLASPDAALVAGTPGATIIPFPDQRTATPASIDQLSASSATLEKLFELKQKGAITEEEYNRAKASLLGKAA